MLCFDDTKSMHKAKQQQACAVRRQATCSSVLSCQTAVGAAEELQQFSTDSGLAADTHVAATCRPIATQSVSAMLKASAACLCWCWCFLQDSVFPLYDKVEAQHVVPGMRALLKQLHAEIDALEASGAASRVRVEVWSVHVGPGDT